MAYNILPMSPTGGFTQIFELGSFDTPFSVSITSNYNYTVGVWCLDLEDSSGNSLLTGLALVPGFDLMARFPDLKASIGSLVLIELNPDDHRSVLLLGSNTQLLWFPVGSAVVIPT